MTARAGGVNPLTPVPDRSEMAANKGGPVRALAPGARCRPRRAPKTRRSEQYFPKPPRIRAGFAQV